MTMVCDPDEDMTLPEDDFDISGFDFEKDGIFGRHYNFDTDEDMILPEDDFDLHYDDVKYDSDFPFFTDFTDDTEFDMHEQEITQEFEAEVDERWAKYEVQERQPLRKMKIHDHQNNKPNKRRVGHAGKQAVQEACWTT